MVDEVKGSKKEDVSILTHPLFFIFIFLHTYTVIIHRNRWGGTVFAARCIRNQLHEDTLANVREYR